MRNCSEKKEEAEPLTKEIHSEKREEDKPLMKESQATFINQNTAQLAAVSRPKFPPTPHLSQSQIFAVAEPRPGHSGGGLHPLYLSHQHLNTA